MYLIDSDTLVFYMRGDPTVIRKIASLAAGSMAMSVISLGELFYGAQESKSVHDPIAQVRRLAGIIPVLGLEAKTMEVYAVIKARMESRGTRLDDMDILIASTAISMRYTLVTHNARHFERIDGLSFEDWTR